MKKRIKKLSLLQLLQKNDLHEMHTAVINTILWKKQRGQLTASSIKLWQQAYVYRKRVPSTGVTKVIGNYGSYRIIYYDI